MSPQPVGTYQVGLICALPKEMLAVKAILDDEHELPATRDAQDSNNYVVGRVHNHNVVIACLPAGIYGTNSAATVASNMLRTFSSIRFGLMVGIGGGIPGDTEERDLRLGDVVVSMPDGVHGGVVQYDLGKNLGRGKFVRKGSLKPPPTVLLTAISSMQARPGTTLRQVAQYTSAVMQKANREDSGYQFPGIDQDYLYCTSPLWLCKTCDDGRIHRSQDRVDAKLYYGTIASGNVLLKTRIERDRLRDEYGAVCVEMEAAGLMNDFPCLVIRGICDYADSHKNDIWQKYAAITAAAVAKTLLMIIKPVEVHNVRCAAAIMYSVEISDPETRALLQQKIQLHRELIKQQRDQSRAFEEQRLKKSMRKCHEVFEKEGSYEGYKEINPQKTPGTCQWVLNHRQYQAWQQSKTNAVLWITADPGCGKSVLARSLVDIDLADTGQYTICYFFFKDNPNQDNLCTAFCAILHQLFSHQPLLLRHVLSAWESNKDDLRTKSEEMWHILLAAAADPSAQPIVCVLDALDECRTEDRQHLIVKLCKFHSLASKKRSGSGLKFLVTSRAYDDVEQLIGQSVSRLPQIRLQSDMKKEINLVIESRVNDLAAKFSLSKPCQEVLQERLRAMQHTTYLWLYLAFEEIHTTLQARPGNGKMEIESLPVSLDDAYERLLAKIPIEHRAFARRVLMIMIGARCPLTIEKMALALGPLEAQEENQTSTMSFDDQHERLAKRILQVCWPFIVYNPPHLSFVHQTAKEFLVAKTLSPRPTSRSSNMTLRKGNIRKEMARL